MAHTPGPWSTINAVGTLISSSRGCIADARLAGLLTREEQIANARLIASAPTLLAALEELIEYAAICAADNDERPASLTAARAAIAAARGEE